MLAKVGRVDECIRREKIDRLPDGLVIRMHWMKRAMAIGCCNEGTISLRSGDGEEVVARWYYGQRVVLSYFPMFGFLPYDMATGPAGLWHQAAVGPVQEVQVGGPAFDCGDLANAAYGADWRRPVKLVQVEPRELAQRAVSLTQRPTYIERSPALDLALSLQEQHYIDQDALRVVASFAEYGATWNSISSSIATFFWRQPPDRRRDLLDIVFVRLESPDEGNDLNTATLGFRLRDDFPDLVPRAEALFFNRRDLKRWQYETALRMLQNQSVVFRSPGYFAEQRRFFLGLANDATESFALFARRATTFGRVYLLLSDDEVQFFGEHLALVPDGLLESISKELVGVWTTS